MATANIVWSFSSLKTFQQCPRKYYYAKVAPDRIREPDTTATLYGKAAHTVAEDYIGNGTPIPPQFAYLKPLLEQLNAIPGEKLVEVKLGLTKDLQACDFDAPDASIDQALDELHLGSRGHHTGFTLKPVPRAYLDDLDVPGGHLLLLQWENPTGEFYYHPRRLPCGPLLDRSRGSLYKLRPPCTRLQRPRGCPWLLTRNSPEAPFPTCA